MVRVVVIALVMLCATAHADTTPTFAIYMKGNDALADKTADALVAALRDLAGAKTSKYRAKGTQKDLVAAFYKVECEIQEPACAAEVGAKLGVDYMFVGTIDTRAKRYELKINVINVSTKARVRSLREKVASTIDAKKWAKTVYARLVDTATGQLSISCNAARGKILVDGQVVTELYDSTAAVMGLALGLHSIEVRANGYKPFTDDVTIDGATKLAVLLDPL